MAFSGEQLRQKRKHEPLNYFLSIAYPLPVQTNFFPRNKFRQDCVLLIRMYVTWKKVHNYLFRVSPDVVQHSPTQILSPLSQRLFLTRLGSLGDFLNKAPEILYPKSFTNSCYALNLNSQERINMDPISQVQHSHQSRESCLKKFPRMVVKNISPPEVLSKEEYGSGPSGLVGGQILVDD